MRYIVTYDSNNSGGGWWLDDDDWYALEEAGWDIRWARDSEFMRDDDGRFLGALATSASIETDDVEAAIRGWESITGQSSMAVGCPCCGEPHSFSFKDTKTGKTSYSSIESVGYERNWF